MGALYKGLNFELSFSCHRFDQNTNEIFLKYDSWFPSEVSKFTSVRNMLDLPLKYCSLKQKLSFGYVMVPKNNQKII